MVGAADSAVVGEEELTPTGRGAGSIMGMPRPGPGGVSAGDVGVVGGREFGALVRGIEVVGGAGPSAERTPDAVDAVAAPRARRWPGEGAAVRCSTDTAAMTNTAAAPTAHGPVWATDALPIRGVGPERSDAGRAASIDCLPRKGRELPGRIRSKREVVAGPPSR